MDFIEIATQGNAQDFGDLFRGYFGGTGCSSPTRGVIWQWRNNSP